MTQSTPGTAAPGPAAGNLERLDFARQLARETGALVRRGFRSSRISTRRKSEIDLVSEYDLAAEEFLTQAIQEQYPQDGILAEESGAARQGEYRWYLDPIDGTINFARGIVPWSISIACGLNEEMLAGVVYDPVQDELFEAVRGGGARLNGEVLAVSTTSDLNDSFFATGFPYDIRTHKQKNLQLFSIMSLNVLAIRRLGSAALDLAYVAAGRYDGYWEHRLGPWDCAAGLLLVQEAGGLVTRLDGGKNLMQEPISLLATNGLIHDPALALLNSI